MLEPSIDHAPTPTGPTVIADTLLAALHPCEPYRAWITDQACKASYESAIASGGFKKRECLKCPRGRALSTERQRKADPLYNQRICVRCGKRPNDERLVLIPQTGGICRGCFNRDRERRKQVNAKGTKPKLLAPLYVGTAIYRTESGGLKARQFTTTGHAEMWRALRRTELGMTLEISYLTDPDTGEAFMTYEDGTRCYPAREDVEVMRIEYNEDQTSAKVVPIELDFSRLRIEPPKPNPVTGWQADNLVNHPRLKPSPNREIPNRNPEKPTGLCRKPPEHAPLHA